MPANAQIFFNQINKIASFDIIDMDPIINKLVNLNETEPLNANFEAISMYFLNNMGSLTIGFLIYLVGLLAILCL